MKRYLSTAIENYKYLAANPEISDRVFNLYDDDEIDDPMTAVIDEVKKNVPLFLHIAEDNWVYKTIESAMIRYVDGEVDPPPCTVIKMPGGYTTLSKRDVEVLQDAIFTAPDWPVGGGLRAYYRYDWPQKYHYECDASPAQIEKIAQGLRQVTGRPVSVVQERPAQITVHKVYPNAEAARHASADTVFHLGLSMAWACAHLKPLVAVRVDDSAYIAPLVSVDDLLVEA